MSEPHFIDESDRERFQSRRKGRRHATGFVHVKKARPPRVPKPKDDGPSPLKRTLTAPVRYIREGAHKVKDAAKRTGHWIKDRALHEGLAFATAPSTLGGIVNVGLVHQARKHGGDAAGRIAANTITANNTVGERGAQMAALATGAHELSRWRNAPAAHEEKKEPQPVAAAPARVHRARKRPKPQDDFTRAEKAVRSLSAKKERLEKAPGLLGAILHPISAITRPSRLSASAKDLEKAVSHRDRIARERPELVHARRERHERIQRHAERKDARHELREHRYVSAGDLAHQGNLHGVTNKQLLGNHRSPAGPIARLSHELDVAKPSEIQRMRGNKRTAAVLQFIGHGHKRARTECS